MQNTEEYNNKELNVFYFLSAKPSSYTLYEDDGTNPDAIKQHQYELTNFKSTGTSSKEINIQISSNGGHYPGLQQKRKLKLSVPNVNGVRAVFINGKKMNITFADASINGISIPLVFEHKEVSVRIVRD